MRPGGPACSDVRSRQVTDIPGSAWQVDREKARSNGPLSETGEANAFTNGTDETIFIFKEFYRRNFSTIIKEKITHFSPAYLQS